MTEASAILDRLYRSPQLDNCLKRMVAKSQRDDFKQELFCALLSKPESLIVDLDARNELLFYVIGIISRKCSNDNGWLFVTMGGNIEAIDIADTPVDMEELRMNDRGWTEIINEIRQMSDKHNTPFFYLLAEGIKMHGSLREISRQTGVELTALHRAMNKIRRHLKAKQ